MKENQVATNEGSDHVQSVAVDDGRTDRGNGNDGGGDTIANRSTDENSNTATTTTTQKCNVIMADTTPPTTTTTTDVVAMRTDNQQRPKSTNSQRSSKDDCTSQSLWWWDNPTQLIQGERLFVPEWDGEAMENEQYRKTNGWRGLDLVHHRYAPVRIVDYYVTYGPGTDIIVLPQNDNVTTTSTATTTHMGQQEQQQRGGAGTQLTGLVEFTAAAESHPGYCHGGSMCSVLDDVVGWVAFCVTGQCREWTGYTVQVNTALCQPVPVCSKLLVHGRITKVLRRKVYVEAKLYDPECDNKVHATCEGLVVLHRGILQVED